MAGDGERDDSTETGKNDVAVVDLSVNGRLVLNTDGRCVIDVEADVSPPRDANADRNLLSAPAADSGGDIGSTSVESETNDPRGGIPEGFGEGMRISASGANADGRNPDPFDEPDAVPGTEGPGDSERVLESSDWTALVSVPLLSLKFRCIGIPRGDLEIPTDGLRTEEKSRALCVSVSIQSRSIGVGLAVRRLSHRSSDVEGVRGGNTLLSLSTLLPSPVRLLLISRLMPSRAASTTINPPVRPMPAEQCNNTGGDVRSE